MFRIEEREPVGPVVALAAVELVEVRRTPVNDPALKVLFITSMWPDRVFPHFGPFVASQALSLEALGIGVDVLAIRGYASSRAYALARPRILKLISDTRPEIVHVHTGHAAVVGLPRISTAKIVSYVGGDLLGHPTGHGISRKSRVEASLFRRLAYLADATITKSHEMERVLSERLQKRNHVIPNGVDLDQFRPRDRAAARARLGWDREERIALFLGNPSDPRKNVALARDAVVMLAERGLPVRLHLAWGAPPDEVPILMAAADVLVLPSLSEGSPNVVKEAMASTLPAVATPVGDVTERFAGVAGCFVAEPNTVAFADAVQAAVHEPRSLAARDAVAPLGLRATAQRIVGVYEGVLTSRSGPRRAGVP